MSITTKQVRKILNKKILQMNDIIADIDGMLTAMETDYFRVAIFGSARLKPDTAHYTQVYELAKQLATIGIDIITGGGPGLMDAANKGARDGRVETPEGAVSRSIGLPVQLPRESDANSHLDVKREHRRFSSRLDEFMRMSHAVVVTPGGIGTVLELFYTWQLIQVNHITARPIFLLGGGEMWPNLMKWMREWPLAMSLLEEKDFEHIFICQTPEDVVKALKPNIESFRTHISQRLSEKD